MKKHNLAPILIFVFLAASNAFAQVEKFDIVTYTTPKGWNITKDAEVLQLSKEDKAAATFCLITVYGSLDAGPDSRANFLASWKALVNETFKSPAQPQIGKPGPKDGWMAEIGLAPITTDELKGAAILTTMTGGGKMLNILVLMNSDSYSREVEAIIDSIKLPPLKAESASSTVPAATPANTGDAAKLVGRWQRSGSSSPSYADPASWGTAGYTTSRYEFKPDGTYIYTERSFRYSYQNIIVVKENGKYAVSGNTLTITPLKSTIASYKKDGGVDALGEVVSSQPRKLETVAYKFTFHFFSGIQEWNLVLQADSPTQRDGPFSNNKSFENAWYFDQKYTDKDLTAVKN